MKENNENQKATPSKAFAMVILCFALTQLSDDDEEKLVEWLWFWNYPF